MCVRECEIGRAPFGPYLKPEVCISKKCIVKEHTCLFGQAFYVVRTPLNVYIENRHQ